MLYPWDFYHLWRLEQLVSVLSGGRPGKGSSVSSSVYRHFEQVRIYFLKRKKKCNSFYFAQSTNLKIIHHLLTKIPDHSEIVPVMPWRIWRSDEGLGECGGSLSKSKEYCVFQRWTRWECFHVFWFFSTVLSYWFHKRLLSLRNLRMVG